MIKECYINGVVELSGKGRADLRLRYRIAHFVLCGLFERRPHARFPQGAGRLRLQVRLLYDPPMPAAAAAICRSRTSSPKPARSPRPDRRRSSSRNQHGDFGRTTGERFIDLLRALNEVEGIERYRISSIEPNLLTDEIIAFCAASPKFQHHFHIRSRAARTKFRTDAPPLYHGAFRRPHRRRAGAMPDAFIGIDVIVGFPGETEEDFRTTYDFLRDSSPLSFTYFLFFGASRNACRRYARQGAAVGGDAPRRRTGRTLRAAARRILRQSRRFRGIPCCSKAPCAAA